MMRCREVTRLIASGDAQHAGWLMRMQLWVHLRMCEHCRRYAAQIRAIGKAARDLLGSPEADDSIRRVEGAILDDIRRAGGEGTRRP